MPAEALEAGKWILGQLVQHLTQCKMYPVLLHGMKHQEHLCVLTDLNAQIISKRTVSSCACWHCTHV